MSFVSNAIFTALSHRDQLTTNNRPFLVLSNRSVPTYLLTYSMEQSPS